MRLIINALVVTTLCICNLRDVQADNVIKTPDYCVGFSDKECARIKRVVDSGVKPKYCEQGFAMADNGLDLTKELTRICFVFLSKQTTNPLNQRIDDARAMVNDNWVSELNLIKVIEVGYKCDLYDEVATSYAAQKIMAGMSEEMNRAGLAGDTTMNLRDRVQNALDEGKKEAKKGACSKLIPSDRARLRSIVSDLTRS